MGVTVIAEFDTVDFAERAARRVKSHFPQAGKSVIKCRPANHAGQHGNCNTYLCQGDRGEPVYRCVH